MAGTAKKKATNNAEVMTKEVSTKMNDAVEKAESATRDIPTNEIFGNGFFNGKQVAQLNAKLSSEHIKAREQGKGKVSYLEGFTVIGMANEIFGFGNWSYRATDLTVIQDEIVQVPVKDEKGNMVKDEKTGDWKRRPQVNIGYRATVEVEVWSQDRQHSVKFSDVGFGNGNFGTRFDAHELAAKEAVTDGFKRALRAFGNQFGNSLYDKQRRGVGEDENAPQIHVQPDPHANQPPIQATVTKVPPQSTTRTQPALPSAPEATKTVERHNVLKAIQNGSLYRDKKNAANMTSEDVKYYQNLAVEYGHKDGIVALAKDFMAKNDIEKKEDMDSHHFFNLAFRMVNYLVEKFNLNPDEAWPSTT